MVTLCASCQHWRPRLRPSLRTRPATESLPCRELTSRRSTLLQGTGLQFNGTVCQWTGRRINSAAKWLVSACRSGTVRRKGCLKSFLSGLKRVAGLVHGNQKTRREKRYQTLWPTQFKPGHPVLTTQQSTFTPPPSAVSPINSHPL